MGCDPHSTFGAFAMACLTIGVAFFLLGISEWLKYRNHQKQKKGKHGCEF